MRSRSGAIDPSEALPRRTFGGPGALPFQLYSSPQRRLTLLTCGWGFEGAPSDLERAVSACVDPPLSPSNSRVRSHAVGASLEDDGQVEQAAALALFHMDLRRAIAALTSSGSTRARLKKRAS